MERTSEARGLGHLMQNRLHTITSDHNQLAGCPRNDRLWFSIKSFPIRRVILVVCPKGHRWPL